MPVVKNTLRVTLLSAAILLSGHAFAQNVSGEDLYKQQCAACHAIQKDAPPGMGPNLHGVVGRPAGAIAGFAHSKEFKTALKGKSWSPELLDKWLENPQKVAKGTYMMYQQADPGVRAAIIDYLKDVK
jgi:cytochrome c